MRAACVFVLAAAVFSGGLPAQAPTAPPPAAPPAPAAGPATSMEAPKLPPFAGALVNFDRRGARVVACVDRASAPKPGQPVTAPPPPAPGVARQTRIWVIENEVMQELMTTGGLCDPSWSPDAKAFAAAGARGVFTFTQPNYDVKVVVAGQAQPQPAREAPARVYSNPVWSPSGRRLAFLVTAGPGGAVQVVDVASGERVLDRPQPAKTLAWGQSDKTLVVDGARIAVP